MYVLYRPRLGAALLFFCHHWILGYRFVVDVPKHTAVAGKDYGIAWILAERVEMCCQR